MAEGACLENRFAVTCNGGSNPSLTARIMMEAGKSRLFLCAPAIWKASFPRGGRTQKIRHRVSPVASITFSCKGPCGKQPGMPEGASPTESRPGRARECAGEAEHNPKPSNIPTTFLSNALITHVQHPPRQSHEWGPANKLSEYQLYKQVNL